MAKLNMIVAAEKGNKSATESAITQTYHLIQRAELFNGLQRTYRPKDDAGEMLPGESQKVVAKVPELVDGFQDALIDLFDVTATKVFANTGAKADIVVDGNTILAAVPVEFLLFIEKRLIDVQTFLGKLPTLDPAFDWEWNDAAGCYVTTPVETHRSKKVMRNHLKAAATDKHPAQVEVYTEDETVGYWNTVKLSGAVPVTQVRDWKEKVTQLQTAVKYAREEANGIDVEQKKVGKDLFSFIFGS